MATATETRAPTSSAARQGALAMAPLLAAVAPFGLVIGATVARSPIDAGLGLSTATLLYGGSAQLAAIALVSSGAGVAAVVVTVMTVNARLALYGAAMGPVMEGQPRWFRWVGAYFIVDPQYVVVSTGVEPGAAAAWRRHYYLGAAATLWIGWHLATVAGYLAGPVVPSSLGLDVAVPLYLAGILVPRLADRPSLAAAATGGLVAAAASGLPAGTGLLLGIAAGIAAAAASDGGGRS